MKLVKTLSTNEHSIISDTQYNNAPELYVDRTSTPIYWEKYGVALSDVALAKANIKNTYDTNGWESFRSNEEKASAARLMAYSLAQVELDEVLTIDEQKQAKLDYVTNSRLSRQNRWEHLRERIAFEVNQAEALSFYTDTKGFKGDYIDAGLPHLELWLTNGTYPALGIDYSTTGFANQPYFTPTMLQMCIDYLVSGTQYIST